MRISRRDRRLLVIALTLVIVPSLSTAKADPITIPGYTVTDLGPANPVYSIYPTGSGTLTASNGQIYAFPQTPSTQLALNSSVMANFPLSVTAPVNDDYTYGNPNNAYAFADWARMNANGFVAATEEYGVSGHYGSNDAYVVQHNANGTWGTPFFLWNGNQEFAQTVESSLITGMNNLNQVLGQMGVTTPGMSGDAFDAVLYNINTHKLTDLTSLLGKSAPDYLNLIPLALDDDGRILLNAIYFDSKLGPMPTRLLLTPDGVSSDPLSVPAPEPGTWAVMALAVVGFVAHRRRERRRTL